MKYFIKLKIDNETFYVLESYDETFKVEEMICASLFNDINYAKQVLTRANKTIELNYNSSDNNYAELCQISEEELLIMNII